MDGSKEYIEHCRTAIYCNVLIRNECNRKKPSTVVSHELLFNKQVLLWISLCSAWKPLLNSSTVDAAILNDWFIVWIASFESWIGHCDWELSSWLPLHSQAKTCRNLDSLTVMQLFFVHFGDVCRFSHKGHPAEKGLKTLRQKTMTFDICKKKTWTTSCEFQASNHVMTLQLLGWSPPPTSNWNKWDQRRCLFLMVNVVVDFAFLGNVTQGLIGECWSILNMTLFHCRHVLEYVVFSKCHPNNWDSLGFAFKLHAP